MTATIEHVHLKRYLAWCEECQDGVRATKAYCENWATKHDAERHGMTS